MTSDLVPFSIVDLWAAAGDAAYNSVLQLQLQFPVVNRQHDPGAIEVATREEDYALRVKCPQVKFRCETGTSEEKKNAAKKNQLINES